MSINLHSTIHNKKESQIMFLELLATLLNVKKKKKYSDS